MYSQATFMMMQVIVFFVGSIAGAGMLYFIRERFEVGVRELLMEYSAEFQTHLFQNIEVIEEQFITYKKHISNIVNLTSVEQVEIQDNFKALNNLIIEFHNEIQSNHDERLALENEIIKLKNIIKRQNKKGIKNGISV